MTDPTIIDPRDYVEQTARLLNLPLQPEHQPGVIANFSRILAVAQRVNEFPLPEEIEIAPHFQP